MVDVTITCESVICAVEIIAEPGQRLLVKGGVVIGIADETIKEKQSIPTTTKITRRGRGWADKPYPELADLVVSKIRKHKKLTTFNLNRALGLTETRDKAKCGAIVKSLLDDGQLMKLSDARYPEYVLATDTV